MKYNHTPVMLGEVLDYLEPKSGQNFIDCTLGGAGYTMAIAERIAPRGKILSIDLDQAAIENAKIKIKKNKNKNIILINDNFKNLLQIVKKYFKKGQTPGFAGIVFDLGLSSAQLQDRNRGFSFQLDAAPLVMSFGEEEKITAEYIVNKYKENELAGIIRQYGEERFARQIARRIIEERKSKKIETAGQLSDIIKKAIPKRYQFSGLHPATRTFQALRIAVNRELENLGEALPQALELIEEGGRIAVISFHSLEDRIVKQFFKKEARDCLCPSEYPACRCQHKARLKILTPRVIRASEEEVLNNPRARSAKLRVAQRISAD